ncbi:ABC-F family ATP-binding cassette domain-containing protein [Anaerococcus sp. AGMB00486]|uniref:ABC-F family ATP-binding cassette domain-containing protein n=2 Tax=Anaerococcus TaxID=165779 RepID=A0ABX2NBX1_9FIRM|nr:MULTISPECIES: ABC-F family ATP-binding cassette domain-containing protein [Anaerococcus]MSS78152.1 ABC-F family ATP-binding cassette domain-containing protein [Anaerococcus porci]NVF12044.1 ABC-F family ATP-binding cassette domain-containing protein [Anaerococcus faecalis]
MIVASVSNLKKSYPTEDIFENVSFTINKGDKIGLIGNNGSGKSTLFNILTGEISKDDGSIHIPNDVRVGYLKQQLGLDSDKSIYDYCLNVFKDLIELEEKLRNLEQEMGEEKNSDKLNDLMKEYQNASDKFEKSNGYSYKSEIRGTLIGMGFSEDDFDKKIRELSGGQKARVELSCLLLEKPDLILLDEPTNHLDINAINFLENFVKNFKGSVIVISHDRYFLDATVSKIFLLDNKSLKIYDGDYTFFMDQRKKDLKVQNHLYKTQQKEIKRQEEIIDRLKNLGGSKRKRGISQSRSRQKFLDKMDRIEKPMDNSESINIKFSPRIQSGVDVLSVKDLEKSYDKTIFENISFDIYRNDRVAIIGENGVGKTTLFRIIMGMEKKNSGKVDIGSSVNIGYFDQEQKSLNLENNIFDEIRGAYPDLTDFQIRSYLAKIMFYGDDVKKPINELSGGQRARISLLKLMLSDCNFILMDEPTNHLDIDSKEALEDAILAYEGTVLVISHDRYFLNKIAVKILDMHKDNMREYLGNYDYYVQKTKEEAMVDEKKPSKTKTQIKKEEKKIKLQRNEIRKIKKEIEKLEKETNSIDAKIHKLTEDSLKDGFFDNQENVIKTFDTIKNLEDKKQRLQNKWLELSLELED